MNGILKIHLIVKDKHGMKNLHLALGSSSDEIMDEIMDDHEIAGLMFACEFAINNHASQMLGKQVRAHFEIVPDKSAKLK